MKKELLIIGSDHAGFKAKEFIKQTLQHLKYRVVDMGTYSTDSVDYPDYAYAVARKVHNKKNVKGILLCSTGIGIAIAANKVPGIRAALVGSIQAARLSREHNDANILVLAGKNFQKEKIKHILITWLTTFFQGGRHQQRVDKITAIEKRYNT